MLGDNLYAFEGEDNGSQNDLTPPTKLYRKSSGAWAEYKSYDEVFFIGGAWTPGEFTYFQNKIWLGTRYKVASSHHWRSIVVSFDGANLVKEFELARDTQDDLPDESLPGKVSAGTGGDIRVMRVGNYLMGFFREHESRVTGKILVYDGWQWYEVLDNPYMTYVATPYKGYFYVGLVSDIPYTWNLNDRWYESPWIGIVRLPFDILTRNERAAQGIATPLELASLPAEATATGAPIPGGGSVMPLTVEATYSPSATSGVKVSIYTSYDGEHYDTEEMKDGVGNPVFGDMPFGAGQTKRRTYHIPGGARFLRVAMTNLDTEQPVTGVRVVATLGNAR